MPNISTEVTNYGDTTVGRDYGVFPPGETVDHVASGSEGLRLIATHPDLSVVVKANPESDSIPDSDSIELAEGLERTGVGAQTTEEVPPEEQEFPTAGGGHPDPNVVTSEDPIEEQEGVQEGTYEVEEEEPS